MKELLVVVLISLLLLAGCGGADSIDRGNEKFGASCLGYYYDEAHDVCIWIYITPYGGGVSVLPASQIRNPRESMKLGR